MSPSLQREPPCSDLYIVTPAAPYMKPQHVRSPSSPVFDRTTSFAIDNLANSGFCRAHRNEASWWGNSFVLVVIPEAEVSCPIEWLSHHNAFWNRNSHKEWHVHHMHLCGHGLCVSLSLHYSMWQASGRNINVCVAVGEWAPPLQLHVALSNCLRAFFLPFTAPLQST